MNAYAKVSFKEAMFGAEKEFDMKLDEPCSHCNGTGVEGGKNAEMKECESCHGTGTVTHVIRTGFMVQQTTTACPKCNGTGYCFDLCHECHGTKRTPKQKHIKVKIPIGIDDNGRLRIKDHGHCGVCGGSNGNLYITVHVEKSDVFTRDGNDLYVDLSIPASIAELGGEVEIPTLTEIKKIKIPAGTKTGAMFRIKNGGFKDSAG